ncbi:DUF3857 domain-containing protein [Filimonas effusa]|uniref:DUF3857 domain-containing protein n=1 Tax=Filimonas effusa TaxID=2508721 RepID=A0A4Q1D5I3_9BACT|nr:DUF3857 domain-containing protein [Filimonas effusa]RXK82877.1 DUF3857 domain-containing protein [Filimonas effusa]
MVSRILYTGLLLIFLVVVQNAYAQDYNVSLIPDSIKENAHIVKRFEEKRVVIKGTDKAIVYSKYAYTILDEEGYYYAHYIHEYSKFKGLSDITGKLFDASGHLLRSVKKKDIRDFAYDDDGTLATDARYKSHDFNYHQYPFTVEYEDEVAYNGIYVLPQWQPVREGNIGVQLSRLVIEADTSYQLRYKQSNYPGNPIITTAKNRTYVWEVKNLMPLIPEPYQLPWEEVTPVVYLAPSVFEYSGYAGNMSNWQELGKFYLKLNQGRDVLPDQVKKEVHALADGITDNKEKIRVLYQYMQRNTRYISIQLGIGGLQPFDASYVAAKKYGDCKALSNYMTSLLKEAGIRSHYVLVNSGKGQQGLIEDFPNDYFDHIIVCVPNGKDSVWLECTNQNIPAGFMGSFTGNRQVLLITEDGGKVAWTPRYSVAENEQRRKVNALVDEEGNLLADITTVFTGIQQEEAFGLIHNATKEQRDRHLNSAFSLPTYKVENVQYSEKMQSLPEVTEILHISSTGYASVSGKRLFVSPNMLSRSGSRLSTEKPRKFDIRFSYGFRDIDTVSIKIPAGYKPEAVPKNVTLSNKFGSYAIAYKVEGNNITVFRKYEIVPDRYPASDFNMLSEFFAAIYKADRNRIVFVKE